MNLSLKRNGLLVRYLSFCYAESNFLPRSFCTLFWLLLFSPLAMPICWGLTSITKTFDYLEKQKKLSLTNTSAKLVAEYRNNPDLAFCDYYQHLGHSDFTGDFRNPNRRIVIAAFEKLSNEYGCSWYAVLRYLKPEMEYDDINDYAKSMSFAYNPTRTKSLIDFSWVSSYLHALGLWATAISCALPLLIIGLNDYLWAISTIGVGIFLHNLLNRTGVYKLACNFYRMVKDKTCPIIVWE